MKSVLRLGLLIFLVISSFDVDAINLEFYQFAPNPGFSQTNNALKTNSLYPDDYPWIFTSSLSYVSNPLTIKKDNQRVTSVLDSFSTLTLGGGFRVRQNLQLSLATNLSYQYGNESEGFFPGDTQLDFIWKFFETKNHALAFQPKIHFPTGTGDYLTNSPQGGAQLGFNIESRFESLQTALNVSYVNSPGAKLTADLNSTTSYMIDLREAIRLGFGGFLPLSGPLSLNLEAYRFQQLRGNQHPNEIYAGLHHRTTKNLFTFGGLSAGGIIDESSNDYRISVGLKYAPQIAETMPAPAPNVITKPRPSEKKITRQEVLKKEGELYGKMYYSLNVYFANNSTVIVETFKKQLRLMQKKFSPGYQFILEGFASERGGEDYNLKLSDQRAEEIAIYLAGLGLDKNNIKTVAYGEAKAISDIDEALNRKVMIRIYKK